MKSFTSIEQSKKLIELGIDVNTADMYWWDCHGFKLSANPYTEEVKKGFETHCLECIPAWSLSALLELIPNYIINKVDDKIYANLYYGLKSSYDNLVDAAFEMVVWLKENGKI